MDKRQFLGAGIGAGLAATAALAQPAPGGRAPAERPARRVIPVRKAKTVPLFLTPAGLAQRDCGGCGTRRLLDPGAAP